MIGKEEIIRIIISNIDKYSESIDFLRRQDIFYLLKILRTIK